MNRITKTFWILVAAQLVFLLAWAGYHEFVRQHAPVILLKGRPVDPRDLLRGDYMILNYDISNVALPNRNESGKGSNKQASTVWVLLEKKDSYHTVVQASYEKLEPKVGQILVRGDSGSRFSPVASTSQVNYGIERYFVPEGKGTPRFKLMEVEVSVSSAHRLYIKRVLLDGQAFP